MKKPLAGRDGRPGPVRGLDRKWYYVYFLATPDRTLYLGITNDVTRRLFEWRCGAPRGCGSPLGAARLVYLEATGSLRHALARKAQLEGWNRNRRWKLIGSVNPAWRDLLAGLLRRRDGG